MLSNITVLFGITSILSSAGYMFLGILAVGGLTAIIGGAVGAAHNAKHKTPTYFESQLDEGMARLRLANGIEPKQEPQEVQDPLEKEVVRDEAQAQNEFEQEQVETQKAESDPVQADAPETDSVAEPASSSVPRKGYEDVPPLKERWPEVVEQDEVSDSEFELENQTALEVADVSMKVSDPEDEMLSRMVDGDMDDLDNFDFDSDFGAFDLSAPVEGEEERLKQLNEMVQSDSGEEIEPEQEDEVLDLDFEEEEEEKEGFARSRYTRTFRAKLIQSSDEVKEYYQALYNELMSYDKMRIAPDKNAFALGRRTYVRMAIAGKTLCVYFALDPNGFNPATFHHRDKSGVRKYANTPMMMRIRSNLSLRKALALVLYLAARYQFHKRMDYVDKDLTSVLAYRTDEELLQLNLIKSNVAAEELDLSVTEADQAEYSAYLAQNREYIHLGPIKQSKVGNTIEADIDRMRTKIYNAVHRNPNASKTGKFVLDPQDDQYRFLLFSPEGALLYASKLYGSTSAVDRGVVGFREMIKKNAPYRLFKSEGKYFCTVRSGNALYRFPDYASKIAAMEAQESVRSTVATAIYES